MIFYLCYYYLYCHNNLSQLVFCYIILLVSSLLYYIRISMCWYIYCIWSNKAFLNLNLNLILSVCRLQVRELSATQIQRLMNMVKTKPWIYIFVWLIALKVTLMNGLLPWTLEDVSFPSNWTLVHKWIFCQKTTSTASKIDQKYTRRKWCWRRVYSGEPIYQQKGYVEWRCNIKVKRAMNCLLSFLVTHFQFLD